MEGGQEPSKTLLRLFNQQNLPIFFETGKKFADFLPKKFAGGVNCTSAIKFMLKIVEITLQYSPFKFTDIIKVGKRGRRPVRPSLPTPLHTY